MNTIKKFIDTQVIPFMQDLTVMTFAILGMVLWAAILSGLITLALMIVHSLK